MSSPAEEVEKENENEIQQSKLSLPIGWSFVSSAGVGFTASGLFKKVGAIFSYGLIGAFAFYQLMNHYGYIKVNWPELFHRVKSDIASSELAEMGVRRFEESRGQLKLTLEKLLGFAIGGMLGLFIF